MGGSPHQWHGAPEQPKVSAGGILLPTSGVCQEMAALKVLQQRGLHRNKQADDHSSLTDVYLRASRHPQRQWLPNPSEHSYLSRLQTLQFRAIVTTTSTLFVWTSLRSLLLPLWSPHSPAIRLTHLTPTF